MIKRALSLIYSSFPLESYIITKHSNKVKNQKEKGSSWHIETQAHAYTLKSVFLGKDFTLLPKR